MRSPKRMARVYKFMKIAAKDSDYDDFNSDDLRRILQDEFPFLDRSQTRDLADELYDDIQERSATSSRRSSATSSGSSGSSNFTYRKSSRRSSGSSGKSSSGSSGKSSRRSSAKSSRRSSASSAKSPKISDIDAKYKKALDNIVIKLKEISIIEDDSLEAYLKIAYPFLKGIDVKKIAQEIQKIRKTRPKNSNEEFYISYD